MLWFGQAETIEIHNPAAREAVRALCLTQRQLRKLKLRFEKVDIDQTGKVDISEFFEMLDEERTPLSNELFALIDLDGNGSIEFDEFVNVLMTYCMYSKEDILRFCFNCFDKDNSDSIDEGEFMLLLGAVNNARPLFPGNFRTALEQFDTNNDGLLDFQEFQLLDKRYPLIFFPAFRLQDQMQKKTLGETAWKRIHEKVERQRRVNDYRLTYGGNPPMSRWETFLECCARPADEIDIFAIDKRKPSIVSLQATHDTRRKLLQGQAEASTPGRRRQSAWQ